ncbi:unnamed protein product [Rotaria socialis]|uniref:Peptidase S59 domain-containing protein n=1 Tax=Rotaria socialis TaxID=392032 RepID=A0A820B3F0_9BILA|nr:unnamed protein product [Rotaria socialis]CAF4201201.1 unnamed protein product [Rotaria socialis]
MSQSTNLFGTQTARQPFMFTASTQNTPPTGLFRNPPVSNTPVNFTSSYFNGASNFGMQQAVPATNSTFPIASKTTQLTFNSGLLPTQATSINSNASISTAPNIFTTATSMKPNASDSLFNKPLSDTTGTSMPFFAFNANTVSTKNNSAQPNSTNTGVFSIKKSETPVPFKFEPQPTPGTGISLQPATKPLHSNTEQTTVTNFFAAPTSIAASNATNMFSTPTTAITTFNLNPSLVTTSAGTQVQSDVISSSSATISQITRQEQTTERPMSMIHQQFIAVSLLDPYANRGRKDFSNMDSIQKHVEPALVPKVPTTTTITATVPTPIPLILPIQTNSRKGSSAHSLVDVNFKLKPVTSISSSSSLTQNDTIKTVTQQSILSTEPLKSTFTDEEELVLLGRTKISKLRLANVISASTYQTNYIPSLYPVRCLADLENFTNITSPSSRIKNQQISHSLTENYDISPNQQQTASIISQRPLSPITSCRSNNDFQTYRLPILTRDNYYMKPTISELKILFHDKGECILSQFTVGHEKYGSVTFYGRIDVAGLNLDEIIQINSHEVIVYSDDNNKPSVGVELNLPARITLLSVYPIDRGTREEITDIARLEAMNYSDYLRKITEKFDGEFLNYGINDGSWTFMVKHFTRYGLDEHQNDFLINSRIINSDETTSLINRYMHLNHQSVLTSNFIEYDGTI